MTIIKRKCKRKRKDNDDDIVTKSKINDLNDTLLESIFKRLSPFKSLFMSKCVSKRWNSIISNPYFTRLLKPQSFAFTLIHPHGECLVTEHPYFRIHQFPLENIIPNKSYTVAASTNDLVVAIHPIYSQNSMYYVVNPLTKQYVQVPIPFAQHISQCCDFRLAIAGFVDGVSTVNVSNRNNKNHGFRFVHISGGMSRNMKATVQIYSSETGQWKTYLFDYFDCSRLQFRPIITWNNKIHWMQEVTERQSKILVIDPFNIDNVAPRVLNLPTGIGNYNRAFNICQNRLRIAQFGETRSSDREHRRIQIWEIEDYDNVNDLGTNYDAKVKLVIDFELKRWLLRHIFTTRIDRYHPSRNHEMVCCHPNDPNVVYFSYNDRLLYCNVVEDICKDMNCRIRSMRDFVSDAFVLLHPP